MSVQNFKLVSEFQTIQRRPFGFADPSVLNPTSVNPLLDGEFLQLTTGYVMARGSGVAAVPSFAYFAERGRYEVQAIQKGPFLYLSAYEADTLIMDATGLALGDPLECADVTIASLTRRGLVKRTTGYILGYVTRLPSSNNGFLRFIHTA